jgi:hypothetical protein
MAAMRENRFIYKCLWVLDAHGEGGDAEALKSMASVISGEAISFMTCN